jgi:hypothetical protein
MTDSVSDSYRRLWQLAIKVAKRRKTSPEHVFDAIGLNLMYPPRADDTFRYDSTPVNASVFGYTGGDGVHFSLLHIDNEVQNESPVVMTVPMKFDQPNWILGANLFEFLALGCKIGFFPLEQIAYEKLQLGNPQKQSVSFDDFPLLAEDDEDGPERWHLTRLMMDKFALRLWDDLETRLNELEQAYYHMLEIKPEEPWKP